MILDGNHKLARPRCIAKDETNIEGVCSGDPILKSYFCSKHSKTYTNEDHSYGKLKTFKLFNNQVFYHLI